MSIVPEGWRLKDRGSRPDVGDRYYENGEWLSVEHPWPEKVPPPDSVIEQVVGGKRLFLERYEALCREHKLVVDRIPSRSPLSVMSVNEKQISTYIAGLEDCS